MSTVAELRTAAQANWPSGYHSSVLTTPKILAFLNSVQRFVCNRFNFSFMEAVAYASTTDETRTIIVPPAGGGEVWTEVDTGTVLRFKDEIAAEIKDTNSQRIPLTRGYKAKLENMLIFGDKTAKGVPSHYALHKSKIWLYDLPYHAANDDNAFIVYMTYYGYLADMADDDSHNELTDVYSEILEYGVTAMGLRIGLDWEGYAVWWNMMLSELAVAIDADQGKQHAMIEEGIQPVEGNSMAAPEFTERVFVQSPITS